MHSIAIASLLAAAATVTSAAPTVKEARSAYYVCYNNGFKGDCSVDPCALTWCPDYTPYTYDKVPAAQHSTPQPAAASTPQWYVCANNGFRGSCSVDPCAIAWCPDYKPYTYEPVGTSAKRSADPTVCAPGTGYFQSCANGFRGCCKADACGSSWCPDFKFGTFEPLAVAAKRADPTVCAPGTGYFQSCSNGFRGCCKADACGSSWCPDFKFGTFEPATSAPAPAVKRSDDPTVCAPGTGYFQSCSNGFRGCCKADACGSSWCPDFKFGTFEPLAVAAKRADPTVCAPGTGYFQSCANGFRGCCKSDACGSSWCPDFKFGTFEPLASTPAPAVAAKRSDPTVCAPGTGYFQVCASGFRGCCKTDACTKGYCSA